MPPPLTIARGAIRRARSSRSAEHRPPLTLLMLIQELSKHRVPLHIEFFFLETVATNVTR